MDDYFKKLDLQIENTSLKEFKNELISPFESSNSTQDAFLNWRFSDTDNIDNYQIISKGYFETGFYFLQNLILDERTHKADIWIFPILFNFVHGSELYFKYINSKLNSLIYAYENEGSFKEFKTEGDHDILNLCYTSISLLKKSYEKIGVFSKDEAKYLRDRFNFIKHYIGFIYDKDRDMTFVRYPQNSSKENFFFIPKTSSSEIENKNLKIKNHNLNVFDFYVWSKKVYLCYLEIHNFLNMKFDIINFENEMYSEMYND